MNIENTKCILFLNLSEVIYQETEMFVYLFIYFS